ncbi:MAG: hypothetical protein A2033_15245 [Bacteroidetes bacterium GWA2_31_9]|nr:MAG: hypothetical protein A2033_15245 [Bacteroidetes bacterium GWA2_31_9]
MATIVEFIKNDFSFTDPYISTDLIKKQLINTKAVVIGEDESYIGYVTSNDIVKSQHVLAIDCISEKPVLEYDTDIYKALSVMQSSGLEVLSVYKNNEFAGLLYKNDLIDYLLKSNEELKIRVKQSSEELNKLKSELENIVENRTKEIQELLNIKKKIFSIIAHDLKAPLGGILGFINLLLKKYKSYDYAKCEEYMTIIKVSTERCISLLDNMLTWSRAKAGNVFFAPEPLCLKKTINDVIDSISVQLNVKNIDIKTNVLAESVYADKFMFETVLRNLISNAIKFSNSDSLIEIETKHDSSNLVVIAVKDYGLGVSKHVIDKLFKPIPISTLGTHNENGTGLGLLICKEFVEKHSGTIKIESSENVGTSVIFSIPNN